MAFKKITEKNIPEKLKLHPNFVVARANKIPLNAKTLRNAKSNDPKTWCNYETACKALERDKSLVGLGFCVSDDIVFLDYDNVIDLQTGQITETWAKDDYEFYSKLTFVEKSFSGSGFHVWVESNGRANHGVGKPQKGLAHMEVFVKGKYGLLTFKPVNGSIKSEIGFIDSVEILKRYNRQPLRIKKGNLNADLSQDVNAHKKGKTNPFMWDGRSIESLPLKQSTKDLIRSGAPVGSRSESLMTVINGLVFSGLDDGQIRTILQSSPLWGKISEKGASSDTWLAREISKARAYVSQIATASPKIDEWNDPLPIKEDVPPSPKFPIECLPGVIADYAIDEAERMQVPDDFLVNPMLVALAGAVGKIPHIKPKRFDDWKERACLWGALIAPKSEMKTPALKVSFSPLRKIEANIAEFCQADMDEWSKEHEVYRLKFKVWERQCKKLLDKDIDAELPEKPAEIRPRPNIPRLITSDSTIEKTADMMEASPGLTLFRDELSGFLLNMSRYNTGSDRQFYLECKSGGAYSVDRMSRPSLYINDLYMNIFGGIQPSVAAKLFCDDGTDDGFFERFQILSYPDPLPAYKLVNRYPNASLKEKYHELLLILHAKKWSDLKSDEFSNIKYCEFDPEAQELFDAWLTKHMNDLKGMPTDDPIHGFMGKARGLVIQLTLLFHLAELPKDTAIVKVEPFQKAVVIVTDYFIPMWRRIFAKFGKSKISTGSSKILDWIKKEKRKSFTIRDIKRNEWSGLKIDDDIEPILDILTENFYISDKKLLSKPNSRGPQKWGYEVNPKVSS